MTAGILNREFPNRTLLTVLPLMKILNWNLKSLEFYRQAQIDEADNAEWISVKDRMPDNEQFVLIIASGKPRENITLENAVVLAEYGSEGWILEMWPEWSDPNVTYWMPLPEPPKEE